MVDVNARAIEIRGQLQAANVTPSTRVVASFHLSDGSRNYVAPIEILPALASNNPTAAGANPIDFIMNEIDRCYLHYARSGVQVLDVQVDIQQPQA
jgi:hypothetical protein